MQADYFGAGIASLSAAAFTFVIFYTAKKVGALVLKQPFSRTAGYGEITSPSGQARLLAWMVLGQSLVFTFSMAVSKQLFSSQEASLAQQHGHQIGGGLEGDIAQAFGLYSGLLALPILVFFIGTIFWGPQLALRGSIPIISIFAMGSTFGAAKDYHLKLGESMSQAEASSYFPGIVASICAFALCWVLAKHIPLLLTKSKKALPATPKAQQDTKMGRSIASQIGKGIATTVTAILCLIAAALAPVVFRSVFQDDSASEKAPIATAWRNNTFQRLGLESPYEMISLPDTSAQLPASTLQMIDSFRSYRCSDSKGTFQVVLSITEFKPGVLFDLDGAASGAVKEIARVLGDNEPKFTTETILVSGLPARRTSYTGQLKGFPYSVKTLVMKDRAQMWQVDVHFTDPSRVVEAERVLSSVTVTPASTLQQ